jgi:hypothetical protein
MNSEPLLAFLRHAEEIRQARFEGLFFRGRRSGTPLTIRGLEGPVNWVRLLSGGNRPLELEHIVVTDPSEPRGPALQPESLTWSSLAPGFEVAAAAATLFKPHGYGPGLATKPGKSEWIAFRLPRTLPRLDLTISVRDDRWAHRAWAVGIEISSDGQSWRSAYSHLDRLVAYQKEVLELLPPAKHQSPEDKAVRLLGQIVQKVVQGNYGAARPLLDKSEIPETVRREVKASLNGGLLRAVHREWTSHGIQLSFRYWTPQEKTWYLQAAAGVISVLRELSPDVCFGFGFVLGVLRHGDFIPHDDDIDLIIAWPRRSAERLADVKKILSAHLTERGYRVSGEHFNHVHVGRPEWPHVFDVFVGFTEDDRVSWFPSARRGLSVGTVFPPKDVIVHGVACPFPAQPEAYLETTYGTAWRQPDSHFMHPWDRAQYADLA